MNLFSHARTQQAPDEAEKLAWLRLIRTENIGPISFYQLIETYGTASAAIEALPDIAARAGRKKPLRVPALSIIEKEYKALQKLGGTLITAADEAYPLALSALSDAPPVLSALGNIELLQKPSIAIVGARNASMNGRKFTEKLAANLGAAGQVISSGLARGIDTSAHKGSLKTGTIAVVAGGIDHIYPPENADLYNEIKEHGLIVAESPLGQKPFAQSFPRRNRIVSGLASGVIVVEATIKSGSLITARLAGEQGRDVFAVPGHPYDPRASGPNKLIRDGATLICNANDVLEHTSNFNATPHFEDSGISDFQNENLPPLPPQDHNSLENAHNTLMNFLSFTPTHTDDLIRETQLPIPLLQTALLEMELAGNIQRLPGNHVVRLDQET